MAKLILEFIDCRSIIGRMARLKTLNVHSGCVNSLQWSDTGHYILSGSDDHRLIVTEPYTGRIRTDFMTSHKSNIFSAKFLPDSSDAKIVSCSGDGMILYTDLERVAETQECVFSCHTSPAYEILTVPGDRNTFLSCGEDCTVRWFDLRTKEKCRKPHCADVSCSFPRVSLNAKRPSIAGYFDQKRLFHHRHVVEPHVPLLSGRRII